MYRWLILLVVIFSSCYKSFEPEVESMPPVLCVEGSIGTLLQTYEIALSYVTETGGNFLSIGVPRAEVYVTDENGSHFYYEEQSKGKYKLSFHAGNIPRIGSTYTLHINTPDGNSFESVPQTIQPCPPVDTLFCKAEKKITYPVDVDGNIHEEEDKTMVIYAGTLGLLATNNKYFYKYRALEQHKSIIMQIGSVLGRTSYDYRSRWFSNIPIANADEYQSFKIDELEMFDMSLQVMETFTPEMDSTESLISTEFCGLVFELQQNSISADAYRFYSEAREQLSSDGRLFDPVASQVHGNIMCITDELYPVCGVFFASDISTRSALLFVGRVGLSSFSELNLNLDAFPVPLDAPIPDDAEATWINKPRL